MAELDQYAVMGNPIAHSKSPSIHNAFARATGQHLTYNPILVPIDGFTDAVYAFRAVGGKGLNVTVPFKSEAYKLCTILSIRAQRAQAVNTLKFFQNGDIYGDNTDGAGLIRDLSNNLGLSLSGIRILILGAGGATRGIVEPLINANPNLIRIANRTPERARAIAGEFAALGPIIGGGLDELADEQFSFIINATSASLEGEVPSLPTTALAPGAWCYDLMYSDHITSFLTWSKEHGAAQIFDGLGMLVEQAAESFFLWRGLRPATAHIIRALRQQQI